MKRNILQIAYCLLIFVFDCSYMFPVPAYPYKIMVQTGNGKMATICMKGDEHQKYAVSEDGYTLINDFDVWWYADLACDGTPIKSNYRLMAIEDETIELKQFKANCPKGIILGNNEKKESVTKQCNRKSIHGEPVIGQRHALVILMQFRDLPFKKTESEFDKLFNSVDYTDGGITGSVRDYYRFASQGQLDYVSDVYGPYTSMYNMKYYGGNAASGGSDSNPLALCIEALKSLPKDLDFSKYDNDGDGLVDNIHIVYAGYGEEAGASSDAIWAHEFPYRISLEDEIGYTFSGYSCSPELRGNRGANITNIGVICHELGHALGAMDYYDTNYGTGGEYDGTGCWDIMANGSWNDDGKTPPNFNPYVRSTVFGWNNQVTLSPNQQISLPRMELDNSEASLIYRVETDHTGDYFLLENRQRYSFDKALPGEGLMIYHVHPNIDKYNKTNTINATSPQGLYPVCASYSEPSRKKYGNINSAECPFPGSKDVRFFSPTSSPAAIAWDGSAAKVSVSYITLNNSDGSVSFVTGNEVIEAPDTSEVSIAKTVVYQESFETDSHKSIMIESLSGKEIWRTYSKGGFVMGADLIPEATDGERLFMLFSSKGSQMNESEAISNEIEVDKNSNYILSFDICCESSFSILPSFDMFIEDDYGVYKVYSQRNSTYSWKNIELPLTFSGDKFKYKLRGAVYSGGLFVDNIKLCKEEITTLGEVKDVCNLVPKLYSLNGVCIGGYHNIEDLPSGIYIIRQGEFTRRILKK